jgi:hypothetical protein
MWAAPSSPVKRTKTNYALAISPLTKSIKAEIPASPSKRKVLLNLEKANDSSFSSFSIEFESPMNTEAEPAVDYASRVTDAELLLADIRRARAEQAAHAFQLDNEIREQLLHATLQQMVGGCHEEAEESTLNASHLKQKRELVLSAISTLDLHILMMETDLEDARLLHAAVVDCSEHQFYEQELKDQLRKTTTN